jgi:AraC family transcriptional regulator
MDPTPVSAAAFVDLLPSARRVSAEWAASLIAVRQTPLRAKVAFADHAIGMYTTGRHRTRREGIGRAVEGWSDPGTINVTPAGLEGTWEASGTSSALVLFLPQAFLSRVIAEHWEADPRRIEIVPRFLARDPIIGAIVTRLAVEAKDGFASGRLYVESACEFLAHHMVHAHSSISAPPPRSVGGLQRHRLTQVLDCIEAGLAEPIPLRELAELAGVSARHFGRAFRQSVGVPPHAYVIARRVVAAQQLLLQQPPLSVDEVATRVGFSSASHLATAFRRQLGCSPTTFRRHHSH